MGRHPAQAVVVLAGLSFALTASAARAGEQERSDRKRSQLPPAVLKAVDENRPGARIEKLEIEKEAGFTLYDIEFEGNDGEIEVAADGSVIDVTSIVNLDEVPPAAASVIEQASRGHGIKRVEKAEVRHRIDTSAGAPRLTPLSTPEYIYEAELKKGGEVEVAADGRIVKAPKFMGKASEPSQAR
jgi:hypothetical protein